MTIINDPELYERLSRPCPEEELRTRATEFYQELRQLREKHKIPELVFSFGIYDENKHLRILNGFAGNFSEAILLASDLFTWALTEPEVPSSVDPK